MLDYPSPIPYNETESFKKGDSMKRISVLLSFVFFISNYSFGQIINVPADQLTIQTAIDASVDGDTVLIADGTYYENINFSGKAIIVASHFLIDGDETHIDSTIINGSRPTNPSRGTVVNFDSGEDTSSVLYGLTITGGTGTYNPSAPHPNVWGSGGIAIGSGAKIIYNKVIYNSVVGTHKYAYGGGILVGSPEHPIQIINNVISNNKAIGVSTEEGGGGGIFCYDVTFTSLIIADNIITNNSVVSTLNEVKGSGGGINYTHSSGSPNIRNNLIINNSARLGGGLKFAAYYNNTDPTLINNTIVNNYASEKGGAIWNEEPIIVLNSILWGNIDPDQNQIFSQGNSTIEYSNVEGGWEGTGNIDSDPLFADTTNYMLSSSSPCIDAGNPSTAYNDIEDPNNPSYPLFPALGKLRNDMGAYGGNSKMLDIGTDVTEISLLPKTFRLSQNYPNPFNPSTKINYSIPKQNYVSIKVFDVLGREIRTLINKEQPQGNYEIEFDGFELTSGIYFYRLQAGGFVESKKMVLIR